MAHLTDADRIRLYGHKTIDELRRELEEPERSFAIEAWVLAGDLTSDGSIKVTTSNGEPLTVNYETNDGTYESLVVTKQGRRISRRAAVSLFARYGGPDANGFSGLFVGRNQALGYTEDGWLTFASTAAPAEVATLRRRAGLAPDEEPKFVKCHLVQMAPDTDAQEAAA